MDLSKVYATFERVMSALLLVGMVFVMILALWSFLRLTAVTVMGFGGDLPYAVFQTLFDRVLAVIIAIEIAHSIKQMVEGAHGRSQLRTVVVIGMLAVVRKLILLEVETTSGLFLVGLAAVIVALAVAYLVIFWIERQRAGAVAATGAEE